jgi:hypothetical protein
MARTQQITHKGKTIFFMDFSNLNIVEDINRVIGESIQHIRTKPMNSLYCLTNISGMHFSSEIKDLFQNFVKGNKPYVKASSVVGLSGLQQIVYNGLMKITGRDIKSFSTLEEAKDWLASKN